MAMINVSSNNSDAGVSTFATWRGWKLAYPWYSLPKAFCSGDDEHLNKLVSSQHFEWG
jgi:hypothetical protein